MKSLLSLLSKLSFKQKAALLILTPIITVLLQIKLILLGLAIIIFFDLVTGVNKTLFNEGVKFNPFRMKFWLILKSKGFRETWRKTYEYGIGICVFAVLEALILKTEPFMIMNMTFTLTGLAVTTSCVIEVYSIFENLEAVTGRNLFKRILKLSPKIKSVIESEKINK